MVSAAKLRRAQDAIVNLRPYAKQITSVVQNIASREVSLEGFPLLTSARAQAESILVIVVTSDRGLCGGFNSNVIKATQRFLKANAGKYKRCDVGFIGKKGYEFFRQRPQPKGKYYQNFFLGINFSKSKVLAEELIETFLSGQYDEIKFIYNEFHSAIAQKVVVENLLPVKFEKEEATEAASTNPKASDAGLETSEPQDTIYEPTREEILTHLLPKYFTLQVHKVVLESLASEHGARMAAMENATKNAGEMMYQLNLEYNKTRQANITKELLEIISGSEAQKA